MALKPDNLPSRFTARNDVTGGLIKSRTEGQDSYAEGWDKIYSNDAPVRSYDTDSNRTVHTCVICLKKFLGDYARHCCKLCNVSEF